ncbi:hypothetical protein DPMN_108234 [Dreissena polymorpha]|uniref:Uncharacterized protein n=1 Tax=Dreissena polymorpha TaxID=45954 RepID=A0A9D4QKR6_DREPO|nr:hypothetical protein DPMN_108234 [Dreissena polymorpha]
MFLYNAAKEHSGVKASLIQLVYKAFVADPVESLAAVQEADVLHAFVFTGFNTFSWIANLAAELLL